MLYKLITDPAFILSILLFIYSGYIYYKNLKITFRINEIHWASFFSMVYSAFYMYGSVRWAWLGLNENIESYDDYLWKAIESLGFLLLIYIIHNIWILMRRLEQPQWLKK